MASQGPLSPATAVSNDAEGNVEWTNPGNVAASDNAYADTSSSVTGGSIAWSVVRLLSGGSEVGSNKNGPTLAGTDSYRSFGGAADGWTAGLSAAQVNSSTFGVRLQVSDSGDTWSTSYYLDVTNFGFSLPSATVDGIVVEVEEKATGGIAHIDHVRITVYYTEAVGGSASYSVGSMMGVG